MKNRLALLSLFVTNAGKTTTHPANETKNPYGYQPARVDRIRKYGAVKE